ncbi:hypothetical protein UA70_18520, partial [Raoultella planticola]
MHKRFYRASTRSTGVLEVTSGAQQRFEHADWHAVQQAMKQRIHLYDHHVGLVVEQLRCITEGKSTDVDF